MYRTSLCLLALSIGMMGCAKAKAPAAKNQAIQEAPSSSAAKAAKPSPYIAKAPRQVSVASRTGSAPVRSAVRRNDTPQSE